MTSVPLGPAYRAEALRRMGESEFDVLVVGGGVVGAGVALDAVSRGLSVAVVEAQDWAAGTSSRSSKLIHGGLRYLEQLDFRLVREALKERDLLLTRLAPHLVRPVPFLFPLRHRLWERFYVGAGIALYDLLDGARTLPRHRHLSRRRALAAAPSLNAQALVGAVQYHDAQVDDARFAMTLARTAAQYGAAVATRARVTGLVRDDGRVTGARVRDLQSDDEIVVRARQVINATGVWTDETGELAATQGGLRVRASKGVHITVPRDRITLHTGLILRTEKSVLFTIPWGRHWIIGTTDTDWSLDKVHPVASRADIDYLLDHVNQVLDTPLSHDDIDGVYTGLRPLLAGDASDTAKLSREHTVARPAPGLVVIAGGKYTTYRVMARDAVDVAVRDLGTAVPPSVTHRLPLLGAEGYEALRNARTRLAARAGLDVARVERLLTRYGSAVVDVLGLVEADPTLGEPLTGAADYLKAEAVYAASHEGALRLEDVLVRRTRISIEERDRGVAAAVEVAALIAPILGWDEEDVRRESERYRAMVQAEMSAELQPDDASADAARARIWEPFDPRTGSRAVA
ncbi:glycerol-3-phosphate dehydrogenase/oxidase [Nonomuraea muscovyensis]|uniref:Glycerol-3-phosphate dehydrogenase n=1 Tax=Nonomuraea muscovyensis TaxID=1124761 RepID=A0A7X0C9J3_9ACTN|nr:glycerol-3-phosphate dehydrogenase/oxidase [Nonomuraea muscovyensis]MBB6349616.1 glycerol-3-phosphate dehydrogenase [Nonomuraea muscovyensis]MDF2711868.1 dependent oxidoreductase [Nonomuraea muscovyensis]